MNIFNFNNDRLIVFFYNKSLNFMLFNSIKSTKLVSNFNTIIAFRKCLIKKATLMKFPTAQKN